MAGGAEQALWLQRFFSEHDNIRAALGWLIRTGNADWGLRLARALSQFWLQHAHPAEGRDWIAALLKLPGGSAAIEDVGARPPPPSVTARRLRIRD